MDLFEIRSKVLIMTYQNTLCKFKGGPKHGYELIIKHGEDLPAIKILQTWDQEQKKWMKHQYKKQNDSVTYLYEEKKNVQ